MSGVVKVTADCPTWKQLTALEFHFARYRARVEPLHRIGEWNCRGMPAKGRDEPSHKHLIPPTAPALVGKFDHLLPMPAALTTPPRIPRSGSTCLPTSEAWLAHSLPPLMLRCGVALMFLLELFAPWLLLVPVRSVRKVGSQQ